MQCQRTKKSPDRAGLCRSVGLSARDSLEERTHATWEKFARGSSSPSQLAFRAKSMNLTFEAACANYPANFFGKSGNTQCQNDRE
jgi:hypothetical protein